MIYVYSLNTITVNMFRKRSAFVHGKFSKNFSYNAINFGLSHSREFSNFFDKLRPIVSSLKFGGLAYSRDWLIGE